MSTLKNLLPNILSGLRLILSPFLFYLILKSYFSIAILIIIFAAVSDGLDGYLARLFKTESKLGKILDPLADKFFVLSTLLAFVYKEKNTALVLLLGISLIREIMIISGYYALKQKKTPFQISPVFSSKINTTILFIFFLIHISFIQTSSLNTQNIEYFFWHPFSNGYNKYIVIYQFIWLMCIFFTLWSAKAYVKFYLALRKAS